LGPELGKEVGPALGVATGEELGKPLRFALGRLVIGPRVWPPLLRTII
jgi:hypothetical protein